MAILLNNWWESERDGRVLAMVLNIGDMVDNRQQSPEDARLLAADGMPWRGVVICMQQTAAYAVFSEFAGHFQLATDNIGDQLIRIAFLNCHRS